MHVYAHIKALVPKDMAGAAMSGTNFFTMMGPAVFLQGLGIAMQGLYPEASRGPAGVQHRAADLRGLPGGDRGAVPVHAQQIMMAS